MSDEQFREIQLNGKQLVFLFMAATVVSVVIFLCGVLVGRGVRAQSGPAADTVAAMGNGAAATAGDPAGRVATPAGPVTAPVPHASTRDSHLTYYERLDSRKPLRETLKPGPPAASRAAVAPPPAQAKAEAPAGAAIRQHAVATRRTRETSGARRSALAPPAGSGYTVQVAALRTRRDADAVARRLLHKGYRAYVVESARGRSTVFRVRVGKFRTRHEARVVAIRLEKEEKFKPWITR